MASLQDELVSALADASKLRDMVINSPDSLFKYACGVERLASCGVQPGSALVNAIRSNSSFKSMLLAGSTICSQMLRIFASNPPDAAICGLAMLLRSTCQIFLQAALEQVVKLDSLIGSLEASGV
jgi:hypothetical protein